jgi:addiction module HigA family antidote
MKSRTATDGVRASLPPGNRLEKLAGDRAGQYSIRVNQQWRICFRWTDAGPEDVEITDYHWRGANMAADTIMGPVDPGEILLEEFLKPLSVSQYHLAKEIGVPARRVNEIVHGQRRISADTALRLARFFGHLGAVLDQLAVALRPGGRERPAGRCARRHPPAHGRQLTSSQWTARTGTCCGPLRRSN